MSQKLIFPIVGVLALVLTIHSCVFFPIWDEYVSLNVNNTSDDSLLIYVASGMLPSTPTVYPDTCLPMDEYVGELNLPHTNDSISGYLIPISPKEKSSILFTIVATDYWGNGRYEKFFDDFIKVDVLSLFFISADSIRKYGYNYVASHNIILARYDLTPSDMKSLDMMIPYPPTEAMKGMKIWKP